MNLLCLCHLQWVGVVSSQWEGGTALKYPAEHQHRL